MDYRDRAAKTTEQRIIIPTQNVPRQVEKSSERVANSAEELRVQSNFGPAVDQSPVLESAHREVRSRPAGRVELLRPRNTSDAYDAAEWGTADAAQRQRSPVQAWRQSPYSTNGARADAQRAAAGGHAAGAA
jgi:hypothetical protein